MSEFGTITNFRGATTGGYLNGTGTSGASGGSGEVTIASSSNNNIGRSAGSNINGGEAGLFRVVMTADGKTVHHDTYTFRFSPASLGTNAIFSWSYDAGVICPSTTNVDTLIGGLAFGRDGAAGTLDTINGRIQINTDGEVFVAVRLGNAALDVTETYRSSFSWTYVVA